MTPIPARCARCDSAFPLFAVVAADAAQYRLSAAVHLLQQLGGHLVVEWQSVLQSLAEESGGEALGMVRPAVSTEKRVARLRSVSTLPRPAS